MSLRYLLHPCLFILHYTRIRLILQGLQDLGFQSINSDFFSYSLSGPVLSEFSR